MNQVERNSYPWITRFKTVWCPGWTKRESRRTLPQWSEFLIRRKPTTVSHSLNLGYQRFTWAVAREANYVLHQNRGFQVCTSTGRPGPRHGGESIGQQNTYCSAREREMAASLAEHKTKPRHSLTTLVHGINTKTIFFSHNFFLS